MTKVGMPGAKEGWQKTDVTMATVLKSQGYATGQFGKNHQGDRDEHLPTMHGFDEFLGSLYHLNAEEEPENRDYPGDMKLANGKTFLEQFGPRGVLKCKADGKGGQTIENSARSPRSAWKPSTRKHSPRPRTSSPARPRPAKPFFCWWNGTRMHFRTHVKAEHIGISGQDEYSDGMVEHDMHVGELLKLIDDLGLADNTIVQYSTDNGPHYNTWPDAGTTPFRGEKNSNWEGAFRVPCFIKWPGHFPAGTTLNGIVSHEDWLPTFAAAAGAPDIKEKLKAGVELNGRTYKNHIDGYNLLDYLSGKAKEVAPQGVHLCERRRRSRGHPRGRLEGHLPRKPRGAAAGLARALRPPAPAAALQPAPRSVRAGPAQLEHLPRLDDRPRFVLGRCRRSPASSS
jgi:arylsulfatase A-like enzyme